jgi:sugar lactone lactonase YvrE/enterochelin esterase-like enzyme
MATVARILPSGLATSTGAAGAAAARLKVAITIAIDAIVVAGERGNMALYDIGRRMRLRPSRIALCAVSSIVAGALAGPASAQTDYPLSPESARPPGVPAGTVTKHEWTSAIFPGTRRDYWIYVPAQYKPETQAAVMVFQDGARFVAPDGRWRIPVVFDNLIHKGEMPVTIGIFVDPGVLPARAPGQQARFNRSYEYDGLGDRYARFLLEELIPEVAKTHKLTEDPNLRAISGSSSGGICSFTAAWNRPDAFRRVLSFIGSYTGLRGGDAYPTLIRKTEPRPIRVFLQDGSRDLDIYSGNWWLGNQAMASALEYAGYDVRFLAGDRGHDAVHGSSILPDALRWLWRDWKSPIVASKGRAGAERHFVTEILDPTEDWQLVSEGHGFTEGPAVDKNGNVFFSDVRQSRIHRIDHQTGKVTVFKEDSGGANGMMFGPDGRLYACQSGRRRIVAYSPQGTEAVIAEDVDSNDLAVNAKGEVWFTDPKNKRVWFVDARGAKRVVHEGLEFPNGVVLSPDQALLAVADSRGKWVWSFQVGADGSLLDGQPFHRLETPDESSDSAADGMTVDSEGFLYVASRLGLEVFDQPGRLNAIVNKPQPGTLSNVVFGGPDLDTLYVTARDKVFRRRVRRRGVFPWQPVKPPEPRL